MQRNPGGRGPAARGNASGRHPQSRLRKARQPPGSVDVQDADRALVFLATFHAQLRTVSKLETPGPSQSLSDVGRHPQAPASACKQDPHCITPSCYPTLGCSRRIRQRVIAYYALALHLDDSHCRPDDPRRRTTPSHPTTSARSPPPAALRLVFIRQIRDTRADLMLRGDQSRSLPSRPYALKIKPIRAQDQVQPRARPARAPRHPRDQAPDPFAIIKRFRVVSHRAFPVTRETRLCVRPPGRPPRAATQHKR
ncbi:hypothetical protein C8J57DRAFT_1517096 [Mycena rebaudengoi]|nr:hypothetical protein C8J57DRAFT_1517096 [Mycena rebaudengoi]